MVKRIFLYTTDNGIAPFKQWFKKFRKRNPDSAARITKRFKPIEEYGHYGDYKYLRDGVYELRYQFGAGYRVYFAEDNDIIVILLCAGDKGSQARDLSKAIEYWKDYQAKKSTHKIPEEG